MGVLQTGRKGLAIVLVSLLCAVSSFSALLFQDANPEALALVFFVMLLLPLLPAFAGFIGTSFGYFPFVVCVALACAIGYLAAGFPAALYFTGAYAPAALALCVMLRRGCSTLSTTGACCLLLMAGLFAAVALPSVLAGKPMYSGVTERIEQFNQSFLDAARYLGFLQEDLVYMQEMFALMIAAVPFVTPVLLCAMGMLGGMFSLLICRRLSRPYRELHPLRPFSKLRLPKGYLIGAGAVIAVALIARNANWYGYDAISETVIAAFSLPLCIQGLCTLCFVLMRGKSARGGCVIPALLGAFLVMSGMVFLILSLVVTILTCLGVCEQIMHIRKRIEERPK